MMMNAMDSLREVCEKVSDGKFPQGFTLMQARHLIDIYLDLARGKKHEFIEYDIARLLESIDIPVRRKGIGWEASPVAA